MVDVVFFLNIIFSLSHLFHPLPSYFFNLLSSIIAFARCHRIFSFSFLLENMRREGQEEVEREEEEKEGEERRGEERRRGKNKEGGGRETSAGDSH